MSGMVANRNPQRSWPAVAKSEDFLMRNTLFAAITALAMVFGNLAVASAAPNIGDGSNLDNMSSLPSYNFAGGS